MKLLLIDDNNEEHELFASQLKEYDPEVTLVSAYDGKEGLEVMHAVNPKMVMLDMNMPGMTGLEALSLIKDDEGFKDMPVYMYSTSDGFISRTLALKMGATNYFCKPKSLKEFETIFSEIFK